MNRIVSVVWGVAAVISVCASLLSCEMLGESTKEECGSIRLSFAGNEEMLTRAYLNLPDTSEFMLKISDVSGNVVYDGKYGDCPEVLDVYPGSYAVRVVSEEFSKPLFDTPVFGDEQCVVVKSGGVCNVKLVCSQQNAGIRLFISPEFLAECADAVLFLKSSDGKLMYSYSETRTAYFLPGMVSLVINRGGEDEILMIRDLVAREMLALKVDVLLEPHDGMSMSVDTSRVWTNDVYVIGSGLPQGTTEDNALSVAQTISSAGQEGVWVCGYIVGGDLTSSNASFSPPFESRTNILLGPRSSTKDRSVCVSVQLSGGDVRESLNIVDNPELLGRRVCIKGDIVEAYYGLVGIKNISDFVCY